MKELHPTSRQYNIEKESWLNYFNRYLFENGTITNQEYKAMCEKIAIHCGTKTKQL